MQDPSYDPGYDPSYDPGYDPSSDPGYDPIDASGFDVPDIGFDMTVMLLDTAWRVAPIIQLAIPYTVAFLVILAAVRWMRKAYYSGAKT